MAQTPTRAHALKVAARFGFVLDEATSGKVGLNYTVCLDHPTHSIGGDCRSIVCSSYPGADDDGVPRTASWLAWNEAIGRMRDEGLQLVECTDHDCEYHFPDEEGSA